MVVKIGKFIGAYIQKSEIVGRLIKGGECIKFEDKTLQRGEIVVFKADI
jgi:hypothetical protein